MQKVVKMKKNVKPIRAVKKMQFESLDWVQVFSTKSMGNSIHCALALYIEDYKGKQRLRLNIKLPHDIINEMGWGLTDRIAIFHAKNENKKFMLVKSDVGYKLQTNDKISFSWLKLSVNFDTDAIPYPNRDVNYHIDSNKLYLDYEDRISI